MPGQESQTFTYPGAKQASNTSLYKLIWKSELYAFSWKCKFVTPNVFLAGHMLHHVKIGLKVKQCVHQIPSIIMEATIQPITRTVLRVRLNIAPDFTWNDQVKKEGGGGKTKSISLASVKEMITGSS